MGIGLPDNRSLGPRNIPRSRRRISTLPNATAVADAAIDAANVGEGVAREFAVLGRSADKEARDRQAKQDQLEIARARSQFLVDKVGLDTEAEETQDFETLGTRYAEGLKRSKEKAAALISSPRARELFSLSIADDAARGISGAQGLARSKRKDFNRATVLGSIDSKLNAALASKDPGTRRSLIEAANGEITAAIEAGDFKRVEGGALKRKFAEDYGTRLLDTMDPDAKIAALQPFVGAPVSPRPLTRGEFIQNEDGSQTTERTISVEDPRLNDGETTLIPSVWMTKDGARQLGKEASIKAAVESGIKFPSFSDTSAADSFARERSDAGGTFSGPLGVSGNNTNSPFGFIPHDKRVAAYNKAVRESLIITERRQRIEERNHEIETDNLERAYINAEDAAARKKVLSDARGFQNIDPSALRRMEDDDEKRGTGIVTDPGIRRDVFARILSGEIGTLAQLSSFSDDLNDGHMLEAQKLVSARRNPNHVTNSSRYRDAETLLRTHFGVPAAGFVVMDSQARIATENFNDARAALLDGAISAQDSGKVGENPNQPAKDEYDPFGRAREMIKEDKDSDREARQRALQDQIDENREKLKGLGKDKSLSDEGRRRERRRLENLIRSNERELGLR